MARKARKVFRINGRVIDRKTKQGAEGLRVEAWDNDLICDDLVGSAVTDEQGAFKIEFDESYFKELFFDRKPDLFFRVFRDDKLIKSTEDSVLWNVEAGDTQIVVEVDLPAEEPKPTQRFVVKGQVLAPDGSPLGGRLIRAFDRDLRSEKLLGETTAGKDGSYEITYTAAQFSRAEKTSADLIVRVYGPSGEILGESSTLFDAQPVETLNPAIKPGAIEIPSEYERILNGLEPLLKDVKVKSIPNPTLMDKLADLKRDDIDFLVGETGIERGKIEAVVSAATQQRNGTMKDFNLPSEFFYGFARQGLALDLRVLLAQGKDRQRIALQEAIRQNIIPASSHEQVDEMLDQIQHVAVQHVLQTPPAEGRYALGDLLKTALPSSEKQAKLLALYAEHEGTIEDFWKGLRAHPDFQKPGEVENIQLTLQLGLLTLNNVPLIQELQRRYKVASIRDLVRLDAAAWTDLVQKQRDGKEIAIPPDVPGATQQEKATNYVNGIVGVLQAAFPTDVVAQIVARAPAINLDAPTRQAVSTFFANSLDLDLRTNHIDTYASQHAATAFNGIADADREQVVRHVKRLQRLLQVSTGPETMTALLGTRLDSAYAIAQIPRATFIDEFRDRLGGDQQAQMVYTKAQQVNAAALNVYTQLNQFLNDVHPMATGTSQETILEVLKESPNLSSLFGSLSVCDCADCRSVYSPAAYFVDLLHMLENSKVNTDKESSFYNESPLAVLLHRRPDLEHIKLTCENTNTLIPYVDLVNEILESYVVLGKLDETAVQDTADSTSEELGANPQYTNEEAYRKLTQAVYPLTMPYNQPLEVDRVYLEHLGSSRYQVMRTFQNNGLPPDLDDLDIACEYLKISPEERDILLGNSSHALVDFYYPPGSQSEPNVPVAPLQGVPEFLKQTGISYLDLIELVKTRFVNPNQGTPQELTLTTPDTAPDLNDKQKKISVDPCDLEHTTIENLDTTIGEQSPALEKMHRFIRLWRKMGWSMRDLDKAMAAQKEWNSNHYAPFSDEVLRIQERDITLDLLQDLARIKRLQAELNLPLLRLLTLWASIDTHGDDSLYKKLFLSKAVLAIDRDFQPGPDGSVLTGYYLFNWDNVPGSEGIRLEEFLKQNLGVTAVQFAKSADGRTINAQGQAGSLSITLNDENTGATLTIQDKSVYEFTVKKEAAKLNIYVKFTISQHVPAILAALQIKSADLDLIRADAQLADDGATLDLANLSTLCRYAILARALKLSIKDFIGLKTLSGIDLFRAPDQTIQFADIVEQVRQSGFSIAQLNYLYRHTSEPPSGLAPQRESLLLLAKSLREGLTKIAEDNTMADDPRVELARAKLGTIFDDTVVDQAVRMIDGSAVYTAPLASLPDAIAEKDTKSGNVLGIDPSKIPALASKKVAYDPNAKVLHFEGVRTAVDQAELLSASVDPAYQTAVNGLFQQRGTVVGDTEVYETPLATLPDALANKDNAGTVLGINPSKIPVLVTKKVAYDPNAKVLRFQGAMATAERDELLGASVDPAYQTAVDNLFQQPQAFIQNALSGFLTARTPSGISDVSESVKNLVLDMPSLDQRLEPVMLDRYGKPTADPARAVTTAIASKFAYLLGKLLPYLITQQSDTFVKQTIADALKLETATAQLLLESVLKSAQKSADPAPRPAVADLLDLTASGLTAEYFRSIDLSKDPSGTPPTLRTDAAVAFDGNAVKLPDGTQSARWSGMLLAPNNGTYTFYVRTNGGVRLSLGDDSVPIIDALPNQVTSESSSSPVTLKASQFYDLRLEVTQLPSQSAILELRWQSASIPKAIIPSDNLYPRDQFHTFSLTFTRLQESALLISTFALNDREVAHFSQQSEDFGGFDLNVLPLTRDAESATQIDAEAPGLFKWWRRVNDYVMLRNGLPQGEVSLIDVFGAALLENTLPALQQGSMGPAVTALQRLLNTAGADPPLSVDGVFGPETNSAVVAFQRAHGLSADGIIGAATWGALQSGRAQLWGVFWAEEAKKRLVRVSGWDAQALDALTGPDGFNLRAVDFKNETWLVQLQDCMRLIKRLGVSPERLFKWAVNPLDYDTAASQAQEIKNTVKAKYDDQAWLTVAKPLSDELRASQKAALISYVLTMPQIRDLGITTSHELSEHFLIDVDMSACMATSRIKQAISSVQLFVQRCLMNLKPGVLPDAIDSDVWQWMKHYRVWEANRKVFLYPENWIESDLRDDKSPFFRDLESQLLQNDVTQETAETAFLSYLEKLDQVARLEICGMYWQENSGDFPTLSLGSSGADVVELQRKLNAMGANPVLKVNGVFDDETLEAVIAFQNSNQLIPDGAVRSETWASLDSTKTITILHIFGRTIHTPHVYYYRRLVNNTTWTAWEKVTANIEGDHLIPVVWNRRLYLFWPIFTAKTARRQSADSSTDKKYWEIKLAWSEYMNLKWSAKQVSSEFMISKYKDEDELDRYLEEKNRFTFKAMIDESSNLAIQVYHDQGLLLGELRFGGFPGSINTYYVSDFKRNISDLIPDVIPGFNMFDNTATLLPPKGGFVDNMTLKEYEWTTSQLTLRVGDFGDEPNPTYLDWTNSLVLQVTPSIFRLLYPHQFQQFALQAQFFYQDEKRAYLVTPGEGVGLALLLSHRDHIPLTYVGKYAEPPQYWPPQGYEWAGPILREKFTMQQSKLIAPAQQRLELNPGK